MKLDFAAGRGAFLTCLILLSSCNQSKEQAVQDSGPLSGIGQSLKHVRHVSKEAEERDKELKRQILGMDSGSSLHGYGN